MDFSGACTPGAYMPRRMRLLYLETVSARLSVPGTPWGTIALKLPTLRADVIAGLTLPGPTNACACRGHVAQSLPARAGSNAPLSAPSKPSLAQPSHPLGGSSDWPGQPVGAQDSPFARGMVAGSLRRLTPAEASTPSSGARIASPGAHRNGRKGVPADSGVRPKWSRVRPCNAHRAGRGRCARRNAAQVGLDEEGHPSRVAPRWCRDFEQRSHRQSAASLLHGHKAPRAAAGCCSLPSP